MLYLKGRDMPTLALYDLGLLSLIILQADPSSDFSELGKELLGGFILAVVVAVAYTFIKLRLRDKNPRAEFISISRVREPDESGKVARE
jgi:hypothetical protein